MRQRSADCGYQGLFFRIVAERYRNRRQRFSLRFNLIAGLDNYELDLG